MYCKTEECPIRAWVNGLMNRFRNLEIWEVGVFKACLFSLGVLVGTYFSKSLKKLAPLFWIAFIGGYLYLIYRLLVEPITKRR